MQSENLSGIKGISPHLDSVLSLVSKGFSHPQAQLLVDKAKEVPAVRTLLGGSEESDQTLKIVTWVLLLAIILLVCMLIYVYAARYISAAPHTNLYGEYVDTKSGLTITINGHDEHKSHLYGIGPRGHFAIQFSPQHGYYKPVMGLNHNVVIHGGKLRVGNAVYTRVKRI